MIYRIYYEPVDWENDFSYCVAQREAGSLFEARDRVGQEYHLPIERLKGRVRDPKVMTMERFIRLLETYPQQEDRVFFSFAEAFPTGFSSWRGNFYDLGLEWETHWSWNGSGSYRPLSVHMLLTQAKEAIGMGFSGYKGGTYLMDELTPLWVASSGECGRTTLTGRTQANSLSRCILETTYLEEEDV